MTFIFLAMKNDMNAELYVSSKYYIIIYSILHGFSFLNGM